MTEKDEPPIAKAIRLQQAGQWQESSEALQPLLQNVEHRQAALRIHAANLKGLGQLVASRDALTELLELEPSDHAARFQLANLLATLEQHEQAVESFQIVTAAVAMPEAHYNMANSLVAMGRTSEAAKSFVKALRMRPRWPECLTNLANAQLELGLHDMARQSLEAALALRGNDPQIRRNLANQLLFAGLSERALHLYESRLEVEPFSRLPRFGLQKLGFQQPDGKRILVQWEQAFGDVMQMLRFVPLLENRAGNVVWQLMKPLQKLAQRSFPGIVIAPPMERPPGEFDARLPYTSLPLALQIHSDEMVPAAPYLKPDPDKVKHWVQAARQAASFPCIGLAWRGRETPRFRSIPVEQLIPVLQTGLPFLALQKDITEEEKRFLSRFPNVRDASPGLDDFDDTAAAIRSTQLVVSIDTAIAHLAGALGHPCWVMLKKASDWRWRASGPKTPWYPLAHLFRQQRPHDWSDAIEKVRLALLTVQERQKGRNGRAAGAKEEAWKT